MMGRIKVKHKRKRSCMFYCIFRFENHIMDDYLWNNAKEHQNEKFPITLVVKKHTRCAGKLQRLKRELAVLTSLIGKA